MHDMRIDFICVREPRTNSWLARPMLLAREKGWVDFVVEKREKQRLPCKNFVFIFDHDSLHVVHICKGERSSILSQNRWCA